MASNAEPWFVGAIASGLQRLLALGLPGTPPAETVKLTGQAWVDALWSANLAWDQAQDAPRIAAGFRDLTRFAIRWPVPAQLRDAMPSRLQQFKLEAPRPTPAQRERAAAIIEEAARAARQRPADPMRVWRRILANPSAYPPYSAQLAREALGTRREPGEDDE